MSTFLPCRRTSGCYNKRLSVLSSRFTRLSTHLLTAEPTNVREPKSSSRVVRIRIRIGELMVNSMISSPFQDWLLASHRLKEHHDNLQRLIGFERSMSEESVTSDSSSQAGKDSNDPADDYRWAEFGQHEAICSGCVQVNEDENIPPLDFHFVVIVRECVFCRNVTRSGLAERRKKISSLRLFASFSH